MFAGISSLRAQTESLLIGPGDLLHVQFYDTPEMEQHPRVNDDGSIMLLFMGRLNVAGKTPDEAAYLVRDLAISTNILQRPQVTIAIEQYATQSVTVSGEVVKPGAYSIITPRPIQDVLTLAGGLSNLADRDITVKRHGSPLDPIHYVVSNEKNPWASGDLTIYPGDSILVRKVGVVYVLGDIQRPGAYPMATNDSRLSILQVLAEAGSATKTAVLAKAKLLRKTQGGYFEVALRIDKLQTGQTADLDLQADDVIYVPFSYMKTFVLNSAASAAAVSASAVSKY